jgi:hypothetical protein
VKTNSWTLPLKNTRLSTPVYKARKIETLKLYWELKDLPPLSTGEKKEQLLQLRIKDNVDLAGLSQPLPPLKDSMLLRPVNSPNTLNKLWLIAPKTETKVKFII